MANVRGCNLPDNLLYDVDNHIWYQELPDGNVKLGMTTVATAMAGQLVAFTPRKAGRAVEAGKSCATVESGKWVAGEIGRPRHGREVNEDSPQARARQRGPYRRLAGGAAGEPAGSRRRHAGRRSALVRKMAADGFAGCAPACPHERRL
jgi:glycine cleavage system H protein